jgi:O-antigen/teichoic acid export membrane protein
MKLKKTWMHESNSQIAPVTGEVPQTLVLRNTLYLVIAQIVSVPLTVAVNAIIARTLGPTEYGHLYLAMTFASFAFLFVEWGQGGVLTGMVARNRENAGELLGSGLLWRAVAAIVLSLLIVLVCHLLNYSPEFLLVLALVLLGSALGTISLACHDVFRGLERMDFGAGTYVAWQFLTAAVVVPLLLLGGRLHALLLAQAGCAVLGAIYLLRSLRPMGVSRLSVHAPTISKLFQGGLPFLVLGLAMALQLNVDAYFLSKLASADAVGWYAASRKIVGLLIYPASALITALYPALCRLRLENPTAFRDTAARALSTTVIFAVPIALGCGLFPDIGMAIFSRESYGPGETNLRWLAAYLLLVYFSMPVGTSLAAAGKQRAWAITQFGCVAVSALLDPILVPWFQTNNNNGGLGICVATVFSEVLMVAAGVWLMPKGILNRHMLTSLGAALVAGAAMFVAAWLSRSLLPIPLLGAAIAVSVYFGSLWAMGVVNSNQLMELRALLGRRTG